MHFFLNCGILLSVFSFLFGCSSWDYEKIADKITAKTAKKLEAQKHLYLIGTGGGMMNDIQMMAMNFQCYHEVDLKEARDLVVYAVQEYLSDINSNENVRPYLHNYPFTSKNVEIQIWFYNPDRSKLPPEKINCVSAINGKLEYFVNSNYWNPIHEETYEEGLKLVNSET